MLRQSSPVTCLIQPRNPYEIRMGRKVSALFSSGNRLGVYRRAASFIAPATGMFLKKNPDICFS
jgi:hypothetical protein